jgi:aminopeptidase N
MSTYILALVVAQFKSIVEKDNNKLMHEIIARPNAIDHKQGDYAQIVGQKLVAAMSNYTDIDFYSVHPDIKMSHVAIPDFSAGAMENWGLLAYR